MKFQENVEKKLETIEGDTKEMKFKNSGHICDAF